MDLWALLARLRRSRIGLILVVCAALALGAAGWFMSKPSYSLTASQALRSTQQARGQAVTTTGSFELGMVAAMMVQNTANHAGGFSGAVVNASNTIVSPPAALPLVTTTVTASSPEQARLALHAAMELNRSFLGQVFSRKGEAQTVDLVDLPYESTPAVSEAPRVRSAGIGLILGGLGGLTLLLLIDALRHRRSSPDGRDVRQSPGR